MNRNRKVVQGIVLAGAVAAMATVTTVNVMASQTKGNETAIVVVSEEVSNAENMTAGIVRNLAEVTLSSLETASADVKKKEVSLVAVGEKDDDDDFTPTAGVLSELLAEEEQKAETESLGGTGITGTLTETLTTALAEASAAAGEETETDALPVEGTEETDEAPAEEATAEFPGEEVSIATDAVAAANPEWANKLMANVEDSLNVRSSASEEAEVIGKLSRGAVADVVELLDGWTHIVSGSVDGYVKNDYCVTGDAAYSLADEICSQTAETLTAGLRLRAEASEEAEIVNQLEEGTKLTVLKDTVSPEGWIAVSYQGESGFVSAEYVNVSMDYATALTIEEEQAKIEAEQAKIEAEQAEKAKSEQVAATGTATQSAGASASVDDVTLLAALIQCESGSQPYEGQVAVGNVVVNRLHSGAYGGSISSVIYAPGQFSPAGSGAVARVAASGAIKSSCIAAAQAALAGENYIGGCTQFRNVACGHPGTVIGSHVFW